MKNFAKLIFILFALLIIAPRISFAQSRDLAGKIFRMQYGTGMYIGKMIQFKENNVIIFGQINLITMQTELKYGKYEIYGNAVHIIFDGYSEKTYIYYQWISKFSIKVSDGNDHISRYAIYNSIEDTFNTDYLRANNITTPVPNYYSPSYNSSQSTYTPTKKICPACGGSKVYTRYGQSQPCSACNATGWIIN